MFKIYFFLLITFVFPLNSYDIAITIDDYPLPNYPLFTVKERTKKFIEICDKHRCKVAFFCVGQHIKDRNDPALLDLLSKHGHFIANHSMMHKALGTLKLEEFKEDLITTDVMLKKYNTMKKWFRYPYLDYGNGTKGSQAKAKEAMQILDDLGYVDGYVTIVTSDWYVNKKLIDALKQKKQIDFDKLKKLYLSLLTEWIEHYINLYKNNLKFDVTHTLLLHDNDLNALYLADILNMLKQKRWNVVSPEIAFKDVLWRQKFIKDCEWAKNKPASLNGDVIDKKIEDLKIFN